MEDFVALEVDSRFGMSTGISAIKYINATILNGGSNTERTARSNAVLNGIVMENFIINPWYDSETESPQTKSFEINDDNVLSYIALFENVTPNEETDLDSNHKYHPPRFPNYKTLTSKFTDITQNLRAVDDNLKICANNSKDGTWILKSDSNSPENISGYVWEADELVYPIIIQHEGYYHNKSWNSMENSVKYWCVGILDYKDEICLDGLLTFPFGPAILTITHTPAIEDQYGGFYEDYWENFNDDGSAKSADESRIRYYTRTGRILGNTTCQTIGMFTAFASGMIDGNVLNPTWEETIVNEEIATTI